MTSTSSGRSAKRTGAERARRRRPHRPRPPRELREAGLAPKKSLGQHFLVDPRALRRIANACELDGETDILEIGPGLGGLTAELASRARRVVAIELDDALAAYLKQRYAGTNVSIINGDALDIDSAQLPLEAGQYVVAGNLPYSVAQPLLRHFLESKSKPKRIVAMVQAEVAESIVAQPGEMSLLGVSVQLFGEPRLLFRLAPAAFYPPPRVRSAVVCIEVSARPRVDVDTETFFRVVRAGFSTKRKQLRNALANGLAIDGAVASGVLSRAGVEPTLRAQALGLEQWASIARAWTQLGKPEGPA
ncbi:MAG: 16S rRNA (adenine(1518)-N(6)/adenine(1519)-N(6))-dimethyltransferase RsmA [Dehalococcoidia bacterium]